MKQVIPIPPEGLPLSAQPTLIECGEGMIPLSALSDKITVYPIYHRQGYEGATAEAYLRESAAARLVRAAEALPPGHRFVVLDGWRSYQVQTSLYEGFRKRLLDQGWVEGESLQRELGKFVAVPSKDIQKPSPHLSGGAVDLTIEGPEGWLDMGTAFDDFSEKAATRYYEDNPPEQDEERIVRANRRLLYHLMTEAGFVNYPKEWWHFEYGTLAWAARKQEQAIYGGILQLSDKSG